jgi:hypothetical protein
MIIVADKKAGCPQMLGACIMPKKLNLSRQHYVADHYVADCV